MGCSSSQPNKVADDSPAALVRQPSASPKKARDTKTQEKIMLVGIGGVGKSTVFKQAKLLYCNGFTKMERDEYHRLIVRQIIKVLIVTVWQGIKSNLVKRTPELEKYLQMLETLPQIPNIRDPSYIAAVRNCLIPAWDFEDVKGAYKKFNTEDTSKSILGDDGHWAGFFLDLAPAILSNTYVVTDDDIVRLRRQTFIPQEIEFAYNGIPIKIVDLGGQLDQRASWDIHYKSASAIVYMLSLADYDQTIDETGRPINKLKYSQETFLKHLIQNESCSGKPLVVLLNKSDVFRDKLQTSSFNAYFKDCESQDSHDPDFAQSFIEDEFSSIKRTPKVSTYVTNATDSKLIANVLVAIIQGVKERSAQLSGITS